MNEYLHIYENKEINEQHIKFAILNDLIKYRFELSFDLSVPLLLIVSTAEI